MYASSAYAATGASFPVGGHGGKVPASSAAAGGGLAQAGERGEMGVCAVCAGAYHQATFGSGEGGGGHGASKKLHDGMDEFVLARGESGLHLCPLHRPLSRDGLTSGTRGHQHGQGLRLDGPREGYVHALPRSSSAASSPSGHGARVDLEHGDRPYRDGPRHPLRRQHDRGDYERDSRAADHAVDELGLALSSQYDDTDFGTAPCEALSARGEAESLAYYEALADALAGTSATFSTDKRSSQDRRQKPSADRATAGQRGAMLSRPAPTQAHDERRSHNTTINNDDDEDDDDSKEDEGEQQAPHHRQLRSSSSYRRDRSLVKSARKSKKVRKQADSSDEEVKQPEIKRSVREYLVGEIDERELAVGRRIAWYPNGPGWIEKVYHGMWRGRQVIIKVPRIKELRGKELRRFREAVAKRITIAHPNVVSCLGACTVPGKFKIIEETLDEGGFSKLLRAHRHSPSSPSTTEDQWSLYHRMMMASDIAAGMAWLHSSVPPIVYGDLNTTNLSVEFREGRAVVKVSNFGFSMLYGPSYYPYKTAPEMLGTCLSSHSSFTRESDVYAFGLILWELLTMEEPYAYSSYCNMDELIESICRQKERPPLPSDCPSALRQLIQACWHHEPICRPNFTQITSKLDEIFIRMAIRDEEGQRFWIENFPKQQTVEWGMFVRAFYRFLKVRPPRGRRLVQNKTSGDGHFRRHEKEREDKEEMVLQCFKALVVAKDGMDDGSMALGSRIAARKKEMVHIQQFGRILDWFGPISKNVTLPPPGPASGEDEFLNPRRHALLRKHGKDQSVKQSCGSKAESRLDDRGSGRCGRRLMRRKRADKNMFSTDTEESDSDEEQEHTTRDLRPDSSESESDADEMIAQGLNPVDFASMLPTELSMAIFRYFDEYDWTELRSVCKNWSAIIETLRSRQARRQRLQSCSGKNRPSDRMTSDLRSSEEVRRRKPRPDPKTFHLARGMSTSSLGAKKRPTTMSSNKLVESDPKDRKSGSSSKMERMGKQFKSSSLLTRKRRTKASSSSSSSDTDGEIDALHEELSLSHTSTRRQPPSAHARNSDDSIYCSWSDDDDYDADLDSASLPRSTKRTLLDDIHAVLTQKWFHGELETADATYRIQNCPQGTFLVRFSTNSTHPGAFTITRVAAGPSIGHIRITRSDDGKGRFIVNKDMVFDSLVETIESTKNILGLVTPCPGSPFAKRFSIPASSNSPSS